MAGGVSAGDEDEDDAATARPRVAKVLVIDDEPLIGRSLQRTLGEHDVVYCETAEDALQAAREQAFDIVLCDVNMPGMGGEGFLAAAPPGLADKVVFMTGGAFAPRMHEFVDQLEHRILAKPFSAQQVRQLVRTVVESTIAGEPATGLRN